MGQRTLNGVGKLSAADLTNGPTQGTVRGANGHPWRALLTKGIPWISTRSTGPIYGVVDTQNKISNQAL